jgi:hypothetical protein
MRALIASAPLADVGGARAQVRLTRRLDKIVKLVDGARGAPAQRVRLQLRRATRRLIAFRRNVTKAAQSGKFAGGLAGQVTTLAGEATAQLSPLVPG